METVSPIVKALHELPVHPDEGGWGWARRIAPRRPRLLYTRALISRPGAPHQNFHFDQEMGRRSALLPSYRLFNVFVPLVDIAADGDGTQFLPGSHLGGMRNELCAAAVARSGRVADDAEAMACMEAPACPAGGIIIFDYRTLHRGLANAGPRDRPVAYGVCATGWARDHVNYPELGVRAAVDGLPNGEDDAEELELTRRAIRGAHPFWRDVESE
jgi:ectoine hydroxylase-related dioxygenase (phytanoyl-CoA dioxygenase family)